MKRLFTFMVLMLILALMAGCGAPEKAVEKAGGGVEQAGETGAKAKAVFAVDRFTDPDRCAGCHSTIYQQWSGSMHNNALKDPVYQKLLQLGSRETNGEIDAFCARCHGPIGVMAGEIPPVDGSMASEISVKGIQCDFCHTVSNATGVGNGAFENEPGPVKRGPFKDAVSTNHQTAYSDLHTKGEFCGMCHNVSHPGNGLPLEATYTEWKNGPYAKAGIQCQDCHMTPGPGVTRPNPGKAADFSGPDRPHIYTHNIAGGNFAVAGLLGSEEHQALAEERLRAAARLEILKNSFKKTANGLSFQVKVANTGAGHYLPTGLTETREMWLEVTVRDSAGKILWQAGSLDEKGNICGEAVVYNTVMLNKDGHHTDKVWEAVKIASDHRIPPKGFVIENITADTGKLTGKLTVTARLLYRFAPQRVIDELFKEETFKVPVLEMTRALTEV